MSYVKPFLRRATRRRPVSKDTEEVTTGHGEDGGEGLKKCLSTLDLVSLGVGSCCGAGMYLTVGLVSRGAGLGASFSFILAGFGSLLSGLCYAELASLCPRTSGSAYMYSYVTVGELVAFVIGWGLLVEYAIGTAASAVALSAAIDTMSNFSYGKAMKLYTGAFLGRPYFDAISVGICMILTLVLSAGVELSASFNHLLNFINLIVFIFFAVCSLLLARTNIFIDNGMFPRGVWGAIREVPTAYFAFIGFDIVASTGEEAKNPSKSIPKSIWVSVLINTFAYVTVTICINNVIPYFSLNTNSAMIYMLGEKQWPNAKYIVSFGAICALFAATFGSLFPLPRVLYAMAKDGLICRQFGYICPSRKTPKLATVVSGCIAAVVSVSVDLSTLIELVLLGTLLAYVLVAVCVLYMRYTFDDDDTGDCIHSPSKQSKSDADNQVTSKSDTNPPFWKGPEDKPSDISISRKLLKYFKRSPTPGECLSTFEMGEVLAVLLGAEVVVSLVLVFGETSLMTGNGHVWVYCCLAPFLLLIVLVLLLLMRLHQNTQRPGFRVPLVPLLPIVVTFFNIYLMVSLSWFTWCLFLVWMMIGFVVYLYYSYRSEVQLESVAEDDKRPLLDNKETSSAEP